MDGFHPSAEAAIRAVLGRHPQTPFLTLGQTALWDEPTKVAFCRMLEEVAPDSAIIAAVHDTDYFAKLPRALRDESFSLVEHNDGETRGLWSAAGEISSLFGSETVAARHVLTENGVEFDRVARDYPGGLEALLNAETNAPGWRALVHNGPQSLIAGDVKLGAAGPALLGQIEWALRETLEMAWPPESDVCPECAAQAHSHVEKILGWAREHIAANPLGTLSDFYRWLTPRLWSLVRGEGSCNLSTSSSLRLFKFNSETATLPRFEFLNLFLDPATREAACRCYNDAVAGSGIYALDQFGPGALPFDVVIPGRGRGTLTVANGKVGIATETPIVLDGRPESAAQLAELLEKLGPDVALVGKAVTLISMLAREFIFVFHESASSYTTRTQAMNTALREAGMKLELHPMLRLKHAAWDAVGEARALFELPPHLASAFGAKRVGAAEFAKRWREVCEEQDALRTALKNCRSPRELLALLAARFGGEWQAKSEEYTAAHETISALRERTGTLENEIARLRWHSKNSLSEAAQLERERGVAFRQEVQPLREKLGALREELARRDCEVPLDPATGKPRKLTREERAAAAIERATDEQAIEQLAAQIASFAAPRAQSASEIAALRNSANTARAQANALVAQKLDLERSPATATARQSLRRLRYEAELERLRRTRDALQTSHGLRSTNFRPTAWWFPLVSPDGRWFNRLARSAQARVEEL